MNGPNNKEKTMHDVVDDAYKRGEWDMFVHLTAAEYGKECYFPQDNGTIYSRVTGKYLPNAEAAYTEWIKYIY